MFRGPEVLKLKKGSIQGAPKLRKGELVRGPTRSPKNFESKETFREPPNLKIQERKYSGGPQIERQEKKIIGGTRQGRGAPKLRDRKTN